MSHLTNAEPCFSWKSYHEFWAIWIFQKSAIIQDFNIRNIQGFFVFHHEKTVTCTSSKSIFQCLWHSAAIGRNESRKHDHWLQYKLLMTLQIMQIYDICSECVRKTMKQNLLQPMLTLLLQRHLLSPYSELKLDQAGVPHSIKYVPRCLISGMYRSSCAINHFIMF